LFEDGSECDEWAFYRGECAPGQGTIGEPPQSMVEVEVFFRAAPVEPSG
jgi:hypothetical protein